MKRPEGKEAKNTRIFASVFRSYTTVVVLVLMLACFFSYNLVRNYVINWHKTELLMKAETIAADANQSSDWKILRRYQKILDAKIVFVSNDKKVYFADDQDSELVVCAVETEKDGELVARALDGEKGAGKAEIDFLSISALYASTPLYDSNGGIKGALFVVRPEKAINGVCRHIIISMLFAAMLAMAFVTIFTTQLARRFTKPLTHMKNAAQKIADGDYSTRVTIFKNDEIGKLGMMLNILTKRLEEVFGSLKDEKCKLEMVLYNIGEGIVSCDQTGKIIHVNNSALGFLEMGSWDGENGQAEQEKKERIYALLQKCMENGGEETDTFQNASRRDIALIATPILNAEGVLLGGVCLLRDVSEEIRLEQRGREYIANVSHELRTPLTGIRGMIEPLIDGIIDTEEEKQDSYRIIDKEAMRLEKMIGEMLELSRLQDGQNTLELERVQLSVPVRSAVHATRMLAEKAGIEVVFDADDDIYVFGLENRIQQLITILLDNAISFTPEGGKINVTVGRGKCKAWIKVKDTGVGIEHQHIPYIWERFYKADKSRMRTTGTGLGLAIAKRIVELLGGCISVSSEVGSGTEFIARLRYFEEKTD